MDDGSFDWAGVRFLAIDHHDARMIRAPGLFAFVRRLENEERILLYVDHADCIGTSALFSHDRWTEALRLGMNELHVCLRARKKLDRLQLRHHLIKRVQPILNLLEPNEEQPTVRDATRCVSRAR
jgi:hypothetical protein